MTFYTFADKGGQQVPANQLDSNFATLLAQTEAASSLIASHVANLDNPHNTTAAQVGAQPSSAILSSLAGLTAGADKLAYFTGASSLALADLAEYSRGLLADADAATWRGDLDVYSTAEVDTAVQGQASNYADDTGAANAYAATFNPAISAHMVGMPLRVKIANTCTGASTFDPGPGAKPIVNQDGSAISAGQIVAGGIYTLIYDGSNYQYFSPTEVLPIISPEQFGAVGDGISNDYSAVVNAMAQAAASGRALIMSKKYYVGANNLTLPAQTIIQGAYKYLGYPNTNTPHDYRDLNTQVIFDPGYGFILSNPSCAISGLLVRIATVGLGARQDSNYETDSAAILAQYSGTAITNSADNNYFSDLLILGFDIAIDAPSGHRGIYQRIGIDCNNGILQNNILDISRVHDVHCWPFLTVGPDPSAASAQYMLRSGIAYRWQNLTDGCTAEHCFCYGYAQGFTCDGSTDVLLSSCWADFPPGATTSTSIGFHNLNSARNTALNHCRASSMGRALVQNSDGVCTVVGFSAWVISQTYIDHLSGVLNLVSPNLDRLGGPTGTKAINIGASVSRFIQIGGSFNDLDCYAVASAAMNLIQIVGYPTYLGSCSNTLVNLMNSLTVLPDGATEGGQITLLPGTSYSDEGALDMYADNLRLFFNSATDHVVEANNFGSGRLDFNVKSSYRVSNIQVVGSQQGAIADATNSTDVVTQFNLALAAMRAHGLIAT